MGLVELVNSNVDPDSNMEVGSTSKPSQRVSEVGFGLGMGHICRVAVLPSPRCAGAGDQYQAVRPLIGIA